MVPRAPGGPNGEGVGGAQAPFTARGPLPLAGCGLRLAVALTNVAARACRVRVRVAEDAGGGGGPAGGVFLVGRTEARVAVAPGATARCAVEYVGVRAGRGALRVDTAVWWCAGEEEVELGGGWAGEEEGAVAHTHALRVPLAFAAAGATG